MELKYELPEGEVWTDEMIEALTKCFVNDMVQTLSDNGHIR